MSLISTVIQFGAPTGKISGVTRDADGLLLSWEENGYKMSVTRNRLAGYLVLEATSKYSYLVETMRFGSTGYLISDENIVIPTFFHEELRSSWFLNQASFAKSVKVIDAQPGEDVYPKVTAALAALKAAGGGTLILPKIGGVGYTTSDWIFVDFHYCRIELNDNIKLTKNTVRQTNAVNPNTGSPNTPNLYDGVFVFRGTTTNYLKGVSLVSENRSIVNGNGLAIQAQGSYVHDAFVNGNYSAVQFTMCDRPLIFGVISENSLSFGIQMGYSPGGIIEQCEGNNPVHENGIQVTANAEHIRTFDPNNQYTWGNYRILNCSAHGCPNHGIGSFGAVGTFILNPKVNNCGNDTGTSQAGPAGGVNVEHDMVNVTRNYRTTIVAPQVTNSIGFAVRTNCVGTQLIGGFARNTRKPTAYTESNPTIWGSAIFVQGAATLDAINFEIDGSDRVGIRANAAGSLYPSVNFVGGKITGCKERAVYAIGFNAVTISPTTEVSNNGDPASTSNPHLYTMEFNNAPGNTDQGTLNLQGIYKNNQGPVCQSSRVGNVSLDNIDGGENNQNANSLAIHAFFISDCFQNFHVGKVHQSANNLKVSRVIRCAGSFGRVFANPDTVTGYQTGSQLSKLDFSAATLSAFNSSTVIYGVQTLGAITVPAQSSGVPGKSTFTATIPGASVGDIVQCAINRDIGDCILTARVTGLLTAADNVTVTLLNPTASPVVLSTGGTCSLRVTRVIGN